MKIDPLSLRLFLAVTELGTIAAAAEREHISASAISKRISEMEFLLKTELIVRSNKGIDLTPAGVALQNLSRGIVNELDGVVSYMRSYASGAQGIIRILANVSALTQFLPRDMKSFTERYPAVGIKLEERVSSEILRGVAENAADIGFYADSGGETPGLVRLPYREDELAVVVPLGHPMAERRSLVVAELLEHQLIGLPTGSFITLELTRAALNLGVSVKFRMHVNSFEVACLMVESGMGLSVVPKMLARRYSKALKIKLVPLKESWCTRRLSICIRSYESLPIAARLFVDHLKPIQGNDE